MLQKIQFVFSIYVLNYLISFLGGFILLETIVYNNRNKTGILLYDMSISFI